MRRRFVKALSAFILIVLMTVSMTGCEKPSEEEAKAFVKDLVEKSYELNDIYFGKGLAYVESGNANDIYMVVDVKERYITKSALAESTKKVFSASYAQSLIDGSFNGYGSEINQNSVQARYMVNYEEDLIYVNKEYEPIVEKINTYNFEKIDINKISSRFIEATVYTVEGNGVEITLVKENNEWRLDSATY